MAGYRIIICLGDFIIYRLCLCVCIINRYGCEYFKYSCSLLLILAYIINKNRVLDNDANEFLNKKKKNDLDATRITRSFFFFYIHIWYVPQSCDTNCITHMEI